MFSTQAYQSYRHIDKNSLNSPNKKLKFLQDQELSGSNTISLSIIALHQYYKNHFQDCIKPPLHQFFVLPQLSQHQPQASMFKAFQFINIEKIQVETHQINNKKNFDYFFENQAIFYCASGSLQLMGRQEQIESPTQKPSDYRKIADIKQNNFFTMINYKNLHNKNAEYLKMIPKCKCEIGRILINKVYGYEWLKNQYKKLNLLTSILYYNEQNHKQLRRFSKLKQFASLIKEENFRRDMFISFQQKDRPFQKIYFLQQGECIFYKQINHIKKGVPNKQNVQICKTKKGAILNGELLLHNNNKFYQLINGFQTQAVNNQQFNQDQDDQTGFQPILKKTFGKMFQLLNLKKYMTEKIVLRKNNQINFYYPIQNISNFSIKANSSNVKLYSISVKSLYKHINESMKDNLLKYCQDFYLSLIRRTVQKFDHFINSNQALDQKQTQSHKTLGGLLQGQNLHKFHQGQKYNGIEIKRSQMQMNSNQNYINLKNAKIALKRTNNLNKKISLLMKDRQKKNGTNYKQKIQQIIINNLKKASVYRPDLERVKLFESNKLQQQQSQQTLIEQHQKVSQQLKTNYNSTPNPHRKMSSQVQQQKSIEKIQFIAQNFQDIFMKVKQNRSQGILRHNEILKKKQKLFNKRYQKSNQFQLFIDQDKLLPQKNKKVSIELKMRGHPQYQQTFNYLKGLNVQGISNSIKTGLQQKINKTNRVKQQFMKIRSECKQCHCYDDIQAQPNPQDRTKINSVRPSTNSNLSNYQSVKDPKYHTMKIGVNWRSQKRFNEHEPLQSVYRRIRIVNEKTRQKYKHGAHLFKRKKQLMSRERRASAPILPSSKDYKK